MILSTPPELGGGEVYVQTLVQELATEVEFSVVTQLTAFRDVMHSLHVPVFPFKFPIKYHSTGAVRLAWLLRPWYWLQLAYVLRRWHPDVLHIQSNEEKIAAAWIASKLHIPVVWTQHGPVDTSGSNVYSRDYRWAAQRAAGVICVSQDVKQSAMRAGIPQNLCHVIYNGVDANFFTPQPYPTAGVFLFLGRFESVKNPELFVRAAALVQKQYPLQKFVMVGDGGLKASVSQLIKDLGVSIQLEGYQPDPKPYLRQACAIVISSLQEGMGIAAVEALASSRPVVATNVGGLPEVVDTTCGLLVPTNDAQALADAMSQVIGNPEDAAQMGRAGREKVERMFSVKTMAQATLGVYHDAIDRGTTR